MSAAFKQWRKQKHAERDQRYAVNWKAIRLAILVRDGYVCRICGCDPCDERLDVHHVDWDRTNNKPRNLVTLCSPCHRAIHLHGYRPGQDDHPEPWGERERGE